MTDHAARRPDGGRSGRRVALAVALVALAGAACTKTSSSDTALRTDGGSAPAGAVGSAAGAVTDARVVAEAGAKSCDQVASGHIEASVTTDDGATVLVTSDGVFDNTSRRAQFTTQMPDLSSLGGSATSSSAGHAWSDALGALSEPMSVVVDGDTFYVQWPSISKLLGASTTWVSISGTGAVHDVAGSAPLGATTNCDVMDLLRGAGGEVSAVGAESVDGVTTTHYQGTIDLTKAADEVPAERRAEVQKGLAKLGDAAKVPVEVWVGDDGIVRRFRATVDPASFAAHGGTGGPVVATVDLTELNQPQTITVPPPDQVSSFDLGKVLGGMMDRFGAGVGGGAS